MGILDNHDSHLAPKQKKAPTSLEVILLVFFLSLETVSQQFRDLRWKRPKKWALLKSSTLAGGVGGCKGRAPHPGPVYFGLVPNCQQMPRPKSWISSRALWRASRMICLWLSPLPVRIILPVSPEFLLFFGTVEQENENVIASSGRRKRPPQLGAKVAGRMLLFLGSLSSFSAAFLGPYLTSLGCLTLQIPATPVGTPTAQEAIKQKDFEILQKNQELSMLKCRFLAGIRSL